MNDTYIKKESTKFINDILAATGINQLPELAPYGFTYGEYLIWFTRYYELANQHEKVKVKEKIDKLVKLIKDDPKKRYEVVKPNETK